MPTPDFAKPCFFNWGAIPPIVIIWYFSMVPSQLNSRLGFINPGLTLDVLFPLVGWVIEGVWRTPFNNREMMIDGIPAPSPSIFTKRTLWIVISISSFNMVIFMGTMGFNNDLNLQKLGIVPHLRLIFPARNLHLEDMSQPAIFEYPRPIYGYTC